MMNVHIEIDENTLKELVIDHLTTRMGGNFDPDHLTIEVKSKQNFKSEWENAQFRATYRQLIHVRRP